MAGDQHFFWGEGRTGVKTQTIWTYILLSSPSEQQIFQWVSCVMPLSSWLRLHSCRLHFSEMFQVFHPRFCPQNLTACALEQYAVNTKESVAHFAPSMLPLLSITQTGENTGVTPPAVTRLLKDVWIWLLGSKLFYFFWVEKGFLWGQKRDFLHCCHSVVPSSRLFTLLQSELASLSVTGMLPPACDSLIGIRNQSDWRKNDVWTLNL